MFLNVLPSACNYASFKDCTGLHTHHASHMNQKNHSSDNKTRLVWTAVIILAFTGIASAARRILILENLIPAAAPPNYPGFDSGFSRHPWITLIHIIPGALFMMLGPLQFNKRLQQNARAYRWLRTLFFIASFSVGTSALGMSYKLSIGGANETAASALFGLYFLFSLSQAVRCLWIRQWLSYREWLLRAFAIGLAVATVRPIVGMFFALSPLSPREFFGIAFWIGFTLHLIAAESWIRYTRPSSTAETSG
jgi:hypothetical protein